MTALLSNAKGRRENQSPSGYTRVLGSEELGNLISRIHATNISAGTELEKIVWERCNKVESIDDYLKADMYPIGVFVANKKQMKGSLIAQKHFEPDFVAFERKATNEKHCYVIELKDGDQFDTKKAAAERKHLHDYLSFISRRIPFITSPIVCSFNAISKEQIVTGFKNQITINEAYTGRELCELLKIDYDAIIEEREAHQKENMHLFIKTLLEISEAKEMIVEQLRDQR